MKLARLILTAFGPFSDTRLDFAATPGLDLHLIYGRNEAGKSSALRAMSDLRFGIPLRSADDFIHPSAQLRIAGEFIAADAAGEGEPIGLVRRKGRGTTLLRFAPGSSPADASEAAGEYESRLAGGLARDDFEAMYALNHARLRSGGDRLLRGEGELGAALFEASAGTRGIASLIAGLEADAKALYNPHGRAVSATINEARRQLDDRRSEWRQAQTRPGEWQTLKRTHEAAAEALKALDERLEALRRRENELTELRTVEPLLREYDQLAHEFSTLAGTSALAADAREQRLAAEQARSRAEADRQLAEREIAACADALAGLSIESSLLEHAAAIERLATQSENAAHSRLLAIRHEGTIARLSEELNHAAARIAPGQPAAALLAALPSLAESTTLDEHLGAVVLLEERLTIARRRTRELAEIARQQAGEAPKMPDATARRHLQTALTTAQTLGDVHRQQAEFERQIGEVELRLNRALAALDCPSAGELAAARPLLDAQLAAARNREAALDEQLRVARDEEQRLVTDLQQQALRQRLLAAEGEVVTADTLREARQHRQARWDALRRHFVDGTPLAGDNAGAARNDAVTGFEAAVNDADRQADLLRADARRAASVEECVARIEAMTRRQQALALEIAGHAAARSAAGEEWRAQLAAAGLPPLAPDALREWQGLRATALEFAERLQTLQTGRARLLGETADSAASLKKALAALEAAALPPASENPSELAALIARAVDCEQAATAAEAGYRAHQRAALGRQAEEEKLRAELAENEMALAAHLAELANWHQRLFLPASASPTALRARLEELTALDRQHSALSEARLRLVEHEGVGRDFSAQATRLAALLGESASGAPEDFADRLRQRLATAREREMQGQRLVDERKRAEEIRQRAITEEGLQQAILARLCADAGASAPAELPACEEAAARRRAVQAALESQRQQLARASIRSEEALRAALSGLDAAAMDSERERCRAEIAQLQAELDSARKSEESARRALEAIDGSGAAALAREAMESAAARYRAALRPWARLRLAHALLREAVSRFRERAQAPMIAAASVYFSLMTDGRYPRLLADEVDGKPVLRAERMDGVPIGIDAMSEGTADQLYLALRLAALELRRASHPPMPLLLDDVLLTADDGRAAQILRALARFAEGSQVMIFTHHRHLLDLARQTLGETGIATHCLGGESV